MSALSKPRYAGLLTRTASRLRTVWEAVGPRRFPWVVLTWTVRREFEVAVRRLNTDLPHLPYGELPASAPLDPERLPALAAAHPWHSSESLQRYLDQGARCFVWWDGDVPAHWRWESDREIYLPYLAAAVHPRQGDLLTVEVFTHPAVRNRGLYTRASLDAVEKARERGYRRLIGLVGSWNRPVHEVMSRKTGYTFEGKIGVWTIGPWTHHVTRGLVPFEIGFPPR